MCAFKIICPMWPQGEEFLAPAHPPAGLDPNGRQATGPEPDDNQASGREPNGGSPGDLATHTGGGER
jgi:hypothetical protein